MSNQNKKVASKVIPEREYVFASSFLKANDGKGTPAERLSRLKEARDIESIHAIVSESFGVTGADVYDAALKKAIEDVKSAVPDFSVFEPLLYKYDCTNIKTAIKCAIKGVSPEGMLFECGTISNDKIIQASQSADFSKIPGEMGKAAKEALESYKKTGETRIIDLAIDKACFADMKAASDMGGVDLIKDIVKTRVDGINILTSMRIQSAGVTADLFSRAFLPGGTIPENVFMQQDGSLKDVKDIRSSVKGKNFEAVEKDIDTDIIKLCEKYRFKPFGPEVAVRFIVLREMEMMNFRIAEAALNAEHREDILRERLRESYV